jgi:hypothetical protein
MDHVLFSKVVMNDALEMKDHQKVMTNVASVTVIALLVLIVLELPMEKQP